MNAEMLERLMCDRALNELPPETAELLDAYLAADPARAAEMRALCETTRLAIAGFKTRDAARLPPFPQARITAARRTGRLLGAGRIVAVAACIVLAFLLGRRTPSPTPAPPPVVEVTAVAGDAGIWSRSIESFRKSEARAPAVPVRWRSPLQWPRKEGAL